MHLKLNRFKREQKSTSQVMERLFFPDGLYGYTDSKNFLLLGSSEDLPFLWLEDQERDLSFVVADPFALCKNYKVHVDKDDLASLRIEEGHNLFLLAIVNPKERPLQLNVEAPLLVDWDERIGRQILLCSKSPH